MKFEWYILLDVVIMNARRMDLVALGLIQQHFMVVVVNSKHVTSCEVALKTCSRYAGAIWLLFLIRSLHLIGVCFGED